MGKVKQKETFPLLLALQAEINKVLYAAKDESVGIPILPYAERMNIELKEALKVEEAKSKSLELQIKQFETIIKGYSTICEKKVKICPECLGAGAYIINGEVEECDRCDSAGWITA